jgi:hypothetical protein
VTSTRPSSAASSMEEVGLRWADLMEAIATSHFDEALTICMWLFNSAFRLEHSGEDTFGACKELACEGEAKLRRAVMARLEQVADASVRNVREGDVGSADQDLDQALWLCSISVGLDLVNPLPASAPADIRAQGLVGNLMCVQLTVRCARAMHAVESQLQLKKQAKGKLVLEESLFADALGQLVGAGLQYLALLHSTDALLQAGEEFVRGTGARLGQAVEDAALPVLAWAELDRGVPGLLVRAQELGGLSLPRALSAAPQVTPSAQVFLPPPPPPPAVEPLSHEEAARLDAALHELSRLARQCAPFLAAAPAQARLGDAVVEMVSALVRLDELWLTLNVSKAVAHAVALDLDKPGGPRVNSIVEDTMHVVNTCFARAVHSLSSIAAEATANHVAGFLGDGFCAILAELLRQHMPAAAVGASSRGPESSPAAKAALQAAAASASSATSASSASAGTADLLRAVERAMHDEAPSAGGAGLCEAINTCETGAEAIAELRREMLAAFRALFPQRLAGLMAPELLAEAAAKLARAQDAVRARVRRPRADAGARRWRRWRWTACRRDRARRCWRGAWRAARTSWA